MENICILKESENIKYYNIIQSYNIINLMNRFSILQRQFKERKLYVKAQIKELDKKINELSLLTPTLSNFSDISQNITKIKDLKSDRDKYLIENKIFRQFDHINRFTKGMMSYKYSFNKMSKPVKDIISSLNQKDIEKRNDIYSPINSTSPDSVNMYSIKTLTVFNLMHRFNKLGKQMHNRKDYVNYEISKLENTFSFDSLNQLEAFKTEKKLINDFDEKYSIFQYFEINKNTFIELTKDLNLN